MENQNESGKKQWHCRGKGHGASSGLYGLGFLGAIIYYIQHADTFVVGLLGVLKAIVWPALMVYKLLEFLKM